MVWLNRYNGYSFPGRELKFRLLPTSQIGGTGTEDASFHTMPSASPLLNQFPSVPSDSECPYRYPASSSDPSYPALPADSLPPAVHKLPTEYDPFKFLSAMAEQSLTGNFSPSTTNHQAHVSQSCAAMATNNSNFLFAHGGSQMQNPFASPGMTSPPPQFYSPQSSACCMYNNGIGPGNRLGDYSPHGSEVEAYAHPQTTMSVNGGGGGGGGGSGGNGGGGEESFACKKNFFYAAEELMAGPEGDSLLSWTRQHPEHWTRAEVLDWLFFVGQERGIDMQYFRGEAFQTLTGRQLCQMSVDDFSRLEPKYGVLLYQMFKKLLSGVAFSKPNGNSQTTAVSQGDQCGPQLSPPFSTVSCDSSRNSPDSSSYHTYHMLRKPCPNFPPPPEGYWKQERQEWKVERTDSLQSDVIDLDSYDFDLSDPPSLPNPAPMEHCPPEYEMFNPSYPSSTPMRTSCFYPGCSYPPQLPRRRPGRPRVKSLPEDDDRGSKDKKAKNQHLWEFIYETLLNPLYNPQYLRWENQREGVFRFVQSEAVAQLWGSRKNNENMTYEKLSRAMRHYYKRGILERVEGRRLVYKFSRKALDRMREKRHNSV